MKHIKNDNLSFIHRRNEMIVLDETLLDINKIIKGKASICGGALRSYIEGNVPRDIDIFMYSDNIDVFERLCEELVDNLSDQVYDVEEIRTTLFSEGNYYAFEFKHAWSETIITVITPQVLYGRECFGTMENIVNEIDINVCRLGLREDNTIYCPEDLISVLNDISNKDMKLIHTRTEEEANRTATRIAKYESYGYMLKELK